MSKSVPERRHPAMMAGALSLLVFAGIYLGGGAPETPDAAARSRIRRAYDASDYHSAVNLAEEAIKSSVDIAAVGDEVARSMMALQMFARAGRLLVEGKLKARTTEVLDQVGMGLQTGNHKWMEDGVGCLRQAVAMSPKDVHLNYDLGLLLWNSGHVDEAAKQCELVTKMDPGNIQAAQILERIEKHNYVSRAIDKESARRQVTFTITLRKGIEPYLGGSWDEKGGYSQLHGWKREKMTAGEEKDGKVTWTATKDLATEIGPWYGALISVFPDAYQPAMSLVRFPLYPYESAAMKIPMDLYPTEDPMPLLKPRDVTPPRKHGDKPRLFMLCVDSGTWNVWMPFMQAGFMPRLAGLTKKATIGIVHSDPPVSTIAFDILNFGTGGQFGLKDILAGGVELLKERGIDLLNYGGIKGKDHTWKVLSQRGISTLYSSWGEQLYYKPGGEEQSFSVTVNADDQAVAGVKPATPAEKVLPFIPESERKGFDGLKVSDHLLVDHFNLGVRKFYEAMELVHKTNPQIALVHLGFCDVGYHAFWDAMDSDIAYIRPDRPRNVRYSKAIEGQQRLLDVFIGELEQEYDLDYDSLIIWSDHGATGGFAKTYYGHDPNAVIVAVGPLFKPGQVLDRQPDISDLTPTVFAAMKQDCPAVYSGKPIVEALVSAPASTPTTASASPSPATTN